MLENCGYEKLVTFCHGDAKPNNFLFRNIEVDIEGILIANQSLHCERLNKVSLICFFESNKIKTTLIIRARMHWSSSDIN